MVIYVRKAGLVLGSKALWCRADSSSTACLLYVTGAWSVINLHVSALTPFLLLQSASCSMCCLAGTPQEGLHVLTSTACTEFFLPYSGHTELCFTMSWQRSSCNMLSATP